MALTVPPCLAGGMTAQCLNGSMRPGSSKKIPPDVRALLAANFVSELGSGLTLPFLLIYLHEIRHIGLALTGLLIAGSSIVGIPAGPAAGALVDKLGPRRVMAGAILLAAVGTGALISVRSPLSALPALFIYGLANGAIWPAWNALFAVMVSDEELRPRVFARSFQLLNLGLGIGAVVAGAVVRVSRPSSFELIYALDAVTYLAVLVALFLLPARSFAVGRHAPDVPAHPRGGYREVLSDRRFQRYLVASSLLAFAGYAAVSAGLVGYATVVVRVRPSVIAWAFGVNTGLIVVLQPLALRLVGKMRRTTALCICAACFASSWGILILAGAFPRSGLGAGLVVAMFGAFALGETLLAPVGAPLVTMLARPSLQGRYNATASSVYSVTSVLGPAVAGAMLGAGLGDYYLALLIASGGGAVLAFRWLRRSLSERIDNAGPLRGATAFAEDETEAALSA